MKASTEKNSRDSISSNKLDVVVLTCHRGSMKSIDKRTVVQASLGINVRPYLKNNQCKKDWDMAQVEGPKFKAQYHQQEKQNLKEGKQKTTPQLHLEVLFCDHTSDEDSYRLHEDIYK
jgi:hypothetical protein